MDIKDIASSLKNTQHVFGFVQALICFVVLSWLVADSNLYREKSICPLAATWAQSQRNKNALTCLTKVQTCSITSLASQN